MVRRIQMTVWIVSYVCQKEKGNEKTKMSLNWLKHFVKYVKNISADDEAGFLLTVVYRTIMKTMNSNCKFMKRLFRRMLGHYFSECTKYVLHTFKMNVKCLPTVPYSKGAMMQLVKLAVNHTFKYCECADRKISNIYKFCVRAQGRRTLLWLVFVFNGD